MNNPEQDINIIEYGSPIGYLIETFLKNRDVDIDDGEVKEIEMIDGAVIQIKSDGNRYILMFNHTKVPF